MNRKQQIAQPPGREDFRLVFRQAREDILFIGIHHLPVQLTPKDELARLKEKVENLDRIYFEGSSRMHHQKDACGKLVHIDSVEWLAYAYHKGESVFLDDLNTANRFELAKKYGLRPFAFAGLYASMGIVMMVERGMADAEDVYHATIGYLDTVRGWGEHFFPIKGSERATDAAMEAAIMCQADYGSLKPLEELANHFAIFNGMVRDAEVYGPVMRDVVSKAGGKNGVVIGSKHIDNLHSALDGREISVPSWPTYVESMGKEVRAVFRKLMESLTRIGI